MKSHTIPTHSITHLQQRTRIDNKYTPPHVAREYTHCVMMMDGLITMRAQGLLNYEEFRIKKEELERKKAILKKQLNDTDNSLISMFAQNEFYSRMISVNVKRALAYKARMGVYPGRAPLGYRNDRPTHTRLREIKPDHKRFPIVQKLFDLALTGEYSVSQIADIANRKWHFRTSRGNKLSSSTLSHVLTSPFYHGQFEYPRGSGNWYAGKHRPMITQNEHVKVQDLVKRYKKT